MSIDTLRDVFKSGSMANVYACVRQAKRRLRHEPVAGPLRNENDRIDGEELRRMVSILPDHARLYFSLGLQYLEQDQPQDKLKALACLKSAESLNFESRPRIALYKALSIAQLGHLDEACQLISSLVSYELTAAENALREEIQQNKKASFGMLSLEESWTGGKKADTSRFADAKTVLVTGDAAARSAGWFPNARYLLADVNVTGLPLQAVASLGIDFDLVLGPAELRGFTLSSGVTFSHWIDL